MNQVNQFFPVTISCSMLEVWNTCNLQGYRSMFQHLNSGRDSVSLIAGGAYAKGLEVARRGYYLDGLGAGEAQEAGLLALVEAYGDFVPYAGDSDKKCLKNVIELYNRYFEAYPLDLDEFVPAHIEGYGRAIEYGFAVELPFLHPDLGIPLHFVGRLDMVVQHQGKLYGLDDKTKSGYPSREQKAADDMYRHMVQTGRSKGAEEPAWAMRGQFTGYSWAMQQMGTPLEGFIIREAWFQSGSSWLQRQVYTPRRQFQIDNWGKQLYRQVEQMIESYNRVKAGGNPYDVYEQVNDSALCVKYGSTCKFAQFCSGELGDRYLGDSFSQSIWIPEEMRRVSLEDYISNITDGGEEMI